MKNNLPHDSPAVFKARALIRVIYITKGAALPLFRNGSRSNLSATLQVNDQPGVFAAHADLHSNVSDDVIAHSIGYALPRRARRLEPNDARDYHVNNQPRRTQPGCVCTQS